MTPWTVAWQAALSMGFSRQEYWCGLPCSTPGDLPNPGIETPSSVSPENLGITKSFGHLRHGGSPPPQIFTYILHKFLLVPDPLNLFYSPCKGSLCVRDPFFFPVVSCDMWDLNSPTRDWTHAPYSGSLKFQLLDHQGIPHDPPFPLRLWREREVGRERGREGRKERS